MKDRIRDNRIILLAALLAGLIAFACGCGQDGGEDGSAGEGPDIRKIDNGYGTIFVLGRRIEHPADTSTSLVVNWKNEPAAEAPGDLEVKLTRGVVYEKGEYTDGKHAGEPLDLHLNLKTDAKATDARPVVLFVPGGGFVSCRIDNKYEDVHRYLIDHGYAVAVMEYHIVGQGRYMDAADDVRSAVDWLREKGKAYGLDTKDGIFLMGNSAGGYVAALEACRNPEGIRCVVNFYGLCDVTNTKADYEEEAIAAHHTPESSDSQFVNGVYSGKSVLDDPAEAERSDPRTYVDGDEPPFLHFHGEKDLLVSPSQSLHLHEALREAGGETVRYAVEGESHGSAGFRTKKALDTALEFMDRYRPAR